MRLDRRSALRLGAAGAMSLAAGEAWSRDQVRTRRAASSLSATSDDIVAFAEGFRLMRARDDARSWERQVEIHARDAQHGNALFLPWHRRQLWHLEQIIARLTGHEAFAMPYWDAREHKTLPDWCVGEGAPLYLAARDGDAESKDYSTAPWGNETRMARLADDDFSVFGGQTPEGAGSLENFGHNRIHALIGGDMGHGLTAARDPMFWLHHCNVDRVWARWQALHAGEAMDADWLRTPLRGFVDGEGRRPRARPVSEVLDIAAMGYRYETPYPFDTFNVPPSGPPGATRRVPLGATVYRARSEGVEGQAGMRLSLPQEAVERMRAADDSLMIRGVGSIRYHAEDNLRDRSLDCELSVGGRRQSLGSAPTFVHLGMGDGHAHHRAYVTGYDFNEAVLNTLAAGDGPAVISVEARDLRPELRRPPPRALALTLDLTLTETRWE